MSDSAVSVPVTAPADHDLALAMGARLIGQCEGCRLAPYQDTGGTWTIGIGTITLAGVPVTADTPPITMDQAVAAMEIELQATSARVDAGFKVSVTINQRAALYSFAYNEGASAERSSSALALLNAGDVQGAADHLLLWNKVRDPATGELVTSDGLTNRRHLECAVFLGQVNP